MKRDEAKFILRAYHLGGKDADDPQFREALEMVKCDPILAEWFAQEQAMDARISEKFQAFPVPPELKGQLLAARKTIPLKEKRWLPLWIAAAACIAVLAALVIVLSGPSKNADMKAFQSYAAETIAKLDRLDIKSREIGELRGWLRSHGAPGDFTLPHVLSDKASIGCRVFNWRGQPVSLVCFNLENGHEVHLFVINRAGLRKVPGELAPQYAAMDHGISTAIWSSDQRVYVLATDAGEQELKRILSPLS